MEPIKPYQPLIRTHEVLLKANGEWLHFAAPHRIFQADNLNEVIPALRKIESVIKENNWHAAGFLSYEAAPAFDPALVTNDYGFPNQRSADETRNRFPLLWFGLYPAPRVISSIERFDHAQPKPASTSQALTWLPTVDRDSYNAAIQQIKEYIAAGRTYQVDYTMRLQTEFKIDPWNFFLRLAQTQNNHAAYIDMGRYVICSASPELFFQLEGETITCRPMKGTMPRGRTTREDQEQAQALKESEKNRAENVMIVDMIRNDLGRIAQIGSVCVPELFTVEKYPTLWQMTSTITAQTTASLTEIFRAVFPCASITGAPKVSTMRIIAELETSPRRIYTGSIGHIAPGRKARFNVAIRTALIDRESQTAEYGIGGGIVWDSTSADEYAEALLKARVLTECSPRFSLLETMLWTPEEGFFLGEKHITRLLDSADYFDFPISSQHGRSSNPEQGEAETTGLPRPPLPKEIIEAYLDQIASQFTSPQRVRVLLDHTGELTHEAKPFQPLPLGPPRTAAGAREQRTPPEANMTLRVCLAEEPTHSGNVFLFHKTTNREVYERAKSHHLQCDDVLLYNEHGELTEFTLGNLVVEMDGELYTPSIDCALLAGTFRAHLLETGQMQERLLRVEELEKCSNVFRINSVRKWQRVVFQ